MDNENGLLRAKNQAQHIFFESTFWMVHKETPLRQTLLAGDMNPLISVIIPTYNHGQFVTQAVDSVLQQTLHPLEVIVVDDGSTDETREKLRCYGERIRYIYQTNQHLSAARNTGIKLARGEWVAFLDSDDMWHPQKLERQLLAIRKLPQPAPIGTDTFRFTTSLPALEMRFQGNPRVQQFGLRDMVYGVSFGSGSGILVPKSHLEKAGLFDESLRAVEDWDLWLRLAAHTPLAKVCECLTFIRMRKDSMSTNVNLIEANHCKVIDKAFSTIPKLQQHPHWRRVALARMYYSLSLTYFDAGIRRSGWLKLLHSFLACPWTSGNTPLLFRTRMAVRRLHPRHQETSKCTM